MIYSFAYHPTWRPLEYWPGKVFDVAAGRGGKRGRWVEYSSLAYCRPFGWSTEGTIRMEGTIPRRVPWGLGSPEKFTWPGELSGTRGGRSWLQFIYVRSLNLEVTFEFSLSAPHWRLLPTGGLYILHYIRGSMDLKLAMSSPFSSTHSFQKEISLTHEQLLSSPCWWTLPQS